MEHRPSGVIEKFNRSKKHFDELPTEMDAFSTAIRHPTSRSVNSMRTLRFQVREKPPLRFGVILGDCVHNLRSALDHLIWQVTLLDGGTPDGGTSWLSIGEAP